MTTESVLSWTWLKTAWFIRGGNGVERKRGEKVALMKSLINFEGAFGGCCLEQSKMEQTGKFPVMPKKRTGKRTTKKKR